MYARTIAPLFLVTAMVASGCAAAGAPRWTYTSDGSGRLMRDPREGPVSPVYYTLYEWK